MPLEDTALEAELISQMSANGLLGSYIPNLAKGLAEGITINLLADNIVNTIDAGVLGGGTSTGPIIGVNPGTLTPLLITTMTQNGFLGTFCTNMATAISEAFCKWFLAGNLALCQHTSVGTGIAVGAAGFCISGLNPDAMFGILMGTLSANGILGEFESNMATAVSDAIVPNLIETALYIQPIQGSTSPIPSAGVGIGKFF